MLTSASQVDGNQRPTRVAGNIGYSPLAAQCCCSRSFVFENETKVKVWRSSMRAEDSGRFQDGWQGDCWIIELLPNF